MMQDNLVISLIGGGAGLAMLFWSLFCGRDPDLSEETRARLAFWRRK